MDEMKFNANFVPISAPFISRDNSDWQNDPISTMAAEFFVHRPYLIMT